MDSPDSVGQRARRRRWELTTEFFPDFDSLDIVDLGGTVDAWMRAPVRPRSVTVLNLLEPGESHVDWIRPVTGDACDAASVLQQELGRHRFDMVFSNAVLEHVGGHSQRAKFAASTTALSDKYWIQTPYRYFPLEPHWLFPGMQFLPLALRAKVAKAWPLGHTPPATGQEALSSVLWTELIGVVELRALYPSAKIVHERIGGLTKSIIAVRN